MSETLNPGRELDALVAERVMGWGPIDIDRNGNPVGINPDYPNKYKCHIVPHYSTDISAAWQVIERLKPKLHYLVLTFHDGADWRCEFENCPAFGESAPHAICLAALKAVEASK